MKSKLDKLRKFTASKGFLIAVSIVCGIVAWLFVLDSHNPNIERTITVEMVRENAEDPAKNNLTLVSELEHMTAEIKISGRETIINNITPADLYIAADFSEVKGAGTSYIKIDAPKCEKLGVKIADYYPKEIAVTYDTRMEVNLPVNVNFDKGLLKEGYELVNITVEPDSIPLNNFASAVENLDYVSVDLADNIVAGSIDSDKTLRFIGRIISNTGNDVTANFESQAITVKLDVAKRVPVRFSWTVEPAADYYVTKEPSANMTTVLVDGNNADLAGLEVIDLGAQTFENVSENILKRYNLGNYLPGSLHSLEASEAVVSAEVSKLAEKTFEIKNISFFGLNESKYEYSFKYFIYDTETLDYREVIYPSVTIKGKPEDLEKVTAAGLLKPTVELPEAVGEFRKIPIAVELPENVLLSTETECFVDVRITEIPEPETPTPPPTDVPTEEPTSEPTEISTEEPTDTPSAEPTEN